MDKMKCLPDGTIDLQWFNSLSNDDQIMFGGKWTAGQFADYKAKKVHLQHNELLNPEIEEYIEDCLEDFQIETEKFGTEEYFLGVKEDGEFMVVAPYFDEFYNHVRHLYIVVKKTGISQEFSYCIFSEEYEFRKIKEEEYKILFNMFDDCLSTIIRLFENDMKILDRNTNLNEVIWDHYGSAFQIKGYGERGYQSRGYYIDWIGFDISDGIENISEYPYLKIFDTPDDEKHYIITEDSFLKGYEIAKNALDKIRTYLENLYLRKNQINDEIL